MTGIVKIISSLSIVCVVCPELQVLNELNNFFNFDHNILLLDSSADADRFVNTKRQGPFTPQTICVFESVDGIVTGLESLTKVESKNTFMVVVRDSANVDTFALLR